MAREENAVTTRIGFTVAVALWAMVATAAGPGSCESLDKGERRIADEILAREYLYDCCDDTIRRCLEKKPVCRLAVRLAEDVCRRVAAGEDTTGIRRALSRRARSMVGGTEPTEIDLTEAPIFGPADAPVTVVIYACARCPYCSKLIPALYEMADGGPLTGDVRLAYRIFPIRGHQGSTEAGLGFEAAADMDGFWPFMLHAYRHFDEFSPGAQLDWAAAVGLDRDEFNNRLRDTATRGRLVESKKEGLVNGVEETPTLFLNGRRWVGDLALDPLVDAIQEEAERVRGDVWITD
jgi:protein-disulfide isomerase